MFGHVRWKVFAARLAVKMARLGERARVMNVVSQKTPAGCCKSRHSRYRPTPTCEVGHDT